MCEVLKGPKEGIGTWTVSDPVVSVNDLPTSLELKKEEIDCLSKGVTFDEVVSDVGQWKASVAGDVQKMLKQCSHETASPCLVLVCAGNSEDQPHNNHSTVEIFKML